MHQMDNVRIRGHLVVEERAKGPVWLAVYTRADGTRTRKTLGLAWARASNRTTRRGAPEWLAPDGSKPTDKHLTPREARDALDALLAEERGRPSGRIIRNRMTVEQLLDAWLEHQRVHGGRRGPLSPGTHRDYISVAKTLTTLLGPTRPIRTIDVADVRRVQDKLASMPSLIGGKYSRKLAPGEPPPRLGQSRRRQIMQRLRQALDFAVERKWIPSNPSRFVHLPAPAGSEPDFNVLEPEQIEAVAIGVLTFTEADTPLLKDGSVDRARLGLMQRRRRMYADAVRFSAYSGLRVGELRALRWRDVDFSGASLRVSRSNPSSAPAGTPETTPKSGKARSVPLTPDAAEALRRVRTLTGVVDADGLVFMTELGGPVQGDKLREALYRGLAAAGLQHMRDRTKPMRWHDLRHTFGTIAVRVFPLSDVQAYMGHANVQTTMRYVHHTPRHDDAAKLAAAFASSGSSENGKLRVLS